MPTPKDPTKSKRRSIFRFPSLFNKYSSVRSSAATSLTVTGTSLTTVGQSHNSTTSSPSLPTSILNTIQSVDASLAAVAIAGGGSLTVAEAIQALNDLRSTIDSTETGADTSHLDNINIDNLRLIAEKFANSKWPSNIPWANPYRFSGYNTLTGEMDPEYPPLAPGRDLSNEKAMPKLVRLAVNAAHHVRVRPDEAREYTVQLGEEGEERAGDRPAEVRLPRSKAGLFKPTDIKFVIERVEESGDGREEEEGVGGTVVVAIRGSRTWMDWLVNFNCNLADAESTTGEPNSKAHSGLLAIKHIMVQRLVKELKDLLNFPSTRPPANQKPRLLLTGHSAGGAVAALLWHDFSCYSPDTLQNYNETVWAQIHSICCITFGAPPVLFPAGAQAAKLSLQHPTSFCIGFVNEGDPVPRADFAYLKALLHVYHEGNLDLQLHRVPSEASTSSDPPSSPPLTTGLLMSLPRMSLHPAGYLVGLRADTSDPSMGLQIRGISLTPILIEKTLACNPTAHSMDTYAQTVIGYFNQDLPSLASRRFQSIRETSIPFPGMDGRVRLEEEFDEWKEAEDLEGCEIWEVRSLEHVAEDSGDGGGSERVQRQAEGGSVLKGMFRQRRIEGVEALEMRLREVFERMMRQEEDVTRV